MSAIKALELLESTSSRLEKEAILDEHCENTLLKRIFALTLDPYTNFYVNKVKKIAPIPGDLNDHVDDAKIDLFLTTVLEKLSKKQLAGNAARAHVQTALSQMTERQQKWCLRLLMKNLRCGVQATTVNKTWPGLVKSFSVQLANTLKSQHVDGKIQLLEDVSYPVRVEPKLDGLRCIVVKCNGAVTMHTRNGNMLETLPTIKAAFDDWLDDNMVFDGEILSKANTWNASVSVMMSHKNAKDDSDIVYNVFDAVPFKEWKEQKSTLPFKDRIKLVEMLIKCLDSESIKQVQGKTVHSESELLAFYAECLDQNHEGIMIKSLDAEYHFKRTDALLKLKPTKTWEGVVVGLYGGRTGTKHEGLFGGFNVLLDNGVTTRVGGGFNDQLRAEIQLDPEAWIGRIVEIEGQPDALTSDALTADGCIRFPVYVRQRDASDVDPKILETYKNWLNESRSEEIEK